MINYPIVQTWVITLEMHNIRKLGDVGTNLASATMGKWYGCECGFQGSKTEFSARACNKRSCLIIQVCVCVCVCVCARVRAYVCLCTKSLQSCPTLLWPHGQQPTRLLHPWDSPGKNTGVGCHAGAGGIPTPQSWCLITQFNSPLSSPVTLHPLIFWHLFFLNVCLFYFHHTTCYCLLFFTFCFL